METEFKYFILREKYKKEYKTKSFALAAWCEHFETMLHELNIGIIKRKPHFWHKGFTYILDNGFKVKIQNKLDFFDYYGIPYQRVTIIDKLGKNSIQAPSIAFKYLNRKDKEVKEYEKIIKYLLSN